MPGTVLSTEDTATNETKIVPSQNFHSGESLGFQDLVCAWASYLHM